MTRRVLTQLKELNVCLSIDDFGTGYSSLTRLQAFPVDTLKIDRSFVVSMDNDAGSREIVRIIIMLARQFGLNLVAEGAERAEQVRYLKRFGCEFAQGYFFAKPLSQQKTEKLLSAECGSVAEVHMADGIAVTGGDEEQVPSPAAMPEANSSCEGSAERM